jgi:hypothetical protein
MIIPIKYNNETEVIMILCSTILEKIKVMFYIIRVGIAAYE